MRVTSFATLALSMESNARGFCFVFVVCSWVWDVVICFDLVVGCGFFFLDLPETT